MTQAAIKEEFEHWCGKNLPNSFLFKDRFLVSHRQENKKYYLVDLGLGSIYQYSNKKQAIKQLSRWIASISQ